MADKALELEERLNRLEEKLKVTFVEIEKRMTQQTPQQAVSNDDRIDELEDLILLMQLETTKMREKVGEGLDFGIAPAVPDISERLNRMESEIASHTTAISSGGTGIEADAPLQAKITELEERINSLPTTTIKVPKEVEKHIKESMQSDMHQLEKRIKTLEALLATRGREDLEKESNVLADVHAILKR